MESTQQRATALTGKDSAAVVLTTREREVVTLIAQGVNGHEIAERLGIGIKTVDTHRRSALIRLGVMGAGMRGDVMLTRYALRMGWVTL